MYVVAWALGDSSHAEDHYIRTPNRDEAKAKYEEVLALDSLYAASFCVELDSTDDTADIKVTVAEPECMEGDRRTK